MATALDNKREKNYMSTLSFSKRLPPVLQLHDPRFMERFIGKKYAKKIRGTVLPGIVVESLRYNADTKEAYYHIVNTYKVRVEKPAIHTTIAQLYCTAHSNGSRKKAARALSFLYKNGFAEGRYRVPQPLGYDPLRRALFYKGFVGPSLLTRLKLRRMTVPSIELAAGWLAHLHAVQARPGKNALNTGNSRISTMEPGAHYFLPRIAQWVPKKYPRFKELYDGLQKGEERWFARHKKQWLIHGDMHPDNIIIAKGEDGDYFAGGIDFTDICLGDFARDIGTFLYDVHEVLRKRSSKQFVQHVQRVFLRKYLGDSGRTLTKDLIRRINFYSAWIGFRATLFYLLQDDAEWLRVLPEAEEYWALTKKNQSARVGLIHHL